MSAVKWGIIGCGDVTERKSGQAYNKIAGSSLVAVMRRDAEKAADYARRHNVPRWYSDAEQLLTDAEVNAVSIATPPSSHLEYAERAIAKGLNIYVEKPVTRNAAEAEAMAQAVHDSGAKLTVAHYRRALPMFLHVKQLLENNTVGADTYVAKP
jgi:predicted dehydrogenase